MLIFSIFLLLNCKTNVNDERKAAIKQFIISVEKRDVKRLYELVDTTVYFRVFDNETFLNHIEYLNKRFKECGSSFEDTSIKINDYRVRSKEYSVPFCLQDANKDDGHSFDLVFIFSDYENDGKIQYVDINKHIINVTPTKPPGGL